MIGEMKSIEVKVCVCTHCVMNGAMEIVESIESLQKLKSQLRFHTTVKINATENLCQKNGHGFSSPLVMINEEVIERATSEMIASKIISMISKG